MRIMQYTKLLYLDQDLDTRLRTQAKRRHESISAIVRLTLRVGLAVIEGKPVAEINALDPPTETSRTEA